MATNDTCCTIVPYFKAHPGKLAEFKQLCEEFVEKTSQETDCLYYGFSFHGDTAHCREGYLNAEAALAHLDSIGDILERALQIADLIRLEIHGPEQELAKLREPLAALDPEFYTLEFGFRR